MKKLERDYGEILWTGRDIKRRSKDPGNGDH